MKIKIALGSFALTMCCVLFFAPRGSMQPLAPLAPLAPQQKDAPKFALLIGINEYKKYETDKVRDLRGTNNDVALMKNLLIGTYQFKLDNTPNSPVKILLNSQATQAGIRDAFKKQLIENAKNYFDKMPTKDPKMGATVVLYYSGHGSKLADQNGDETDEIDETIVPHDSTTNVQTQKDIRDDEFDVWFKELKNYTTNITFIFDSCHSGTVTRGGASKSIERQIKTSKNSRGNGQTLSDGINIPSEESYVTVSGSLPTEESQEDPNFLNPDTKKPQWNGALTYNFVTLLKQDPDITYREIINRIQPAVAGFRQTPQAEGDIDRTVFGSSATRGKTPIFMTTSRLTKKTFDAASQPEDVFIVTMTVGTIVGAGKDAALAVFAKKPGEKVRSQIGSGIVTTATDFQSTAELVLFDKTIKEMPTDAVINIVSPNYSKGDKQIVALDTTKKTAADKGTEMLSGVEEKLKTSQMLKTVRLNNVLASLAQPKSSASAKPEENWEVAVVRGSYKDFKLGNPQPDIKETTSGKGDAGKCATTQFVADKAVEPADSQEGYFLIGKQSKMPLYNLWYAVDNENAGACLADALEKHARIENLRNLSSGGSKLNAELKVEIVRLDAKSTEKAKYEAEAQQQLQQCEAGNIQPVKEDTSNAPQFKESDMFYLKITNASQRDLFVYLYSLTTSGAIKLIFPPEGSAQSEKLPAGKTICTIQKGILFDIESSDKSPPGVETFKVIATKQEFPARLLVQGEIMTSRGKGASPLDQLLNQTAAGSRNGTVAFGVDEWATKNINIEIVRQ